MLVHMELVRIIISEINDQQVVFLREVDGPRALHMRVGGLPQTPEWPLNYRLFFAVQGLINEYIEPCRVIRGGRTEIVPGLSELESLTFPEPFGELEAFQTSGGTGLSLS